MNLVNIRAVAAPYGAGLASEAESDKAPELTATARSRAWHRRRLHEMYRATLQHYRETNSDWMKNFSRQTLSNIWDSYRENRT